MPQWPASSSSGACWWCASFLAAWLQCAARLFSLRLGNPLDNVWYRLLSPARPDLTWTDAHHSSFGVSLWWGEGMLRQVFGQGIFWGTCHIMCCMFCGLVASSGIQWHPVARARCCNVLGCCGLPLQPLVESKWKDNMFLLADAQDSVSSSIPFWALLQVSLVQIHSVMFCTWGFGSVRIAWRGTS